MISFQRFFLYSCAFFAIAYINSLIFPFDLLLSAYCFTGIVAFIYGLLWASTQGWKSFHVEVDTNRSRGKFYQSIADAVEKGTLSKDTLEELLSRK